MHLVYKQPSFYHFSEDSTFLASTAAKMYPSRSRVLDLCAGCGVVGIEYASLNQDLKSLTFIESQIEYKEYLETNSLQISTKKISYKFSSFKEIISIDPFDLILCNPPYYAREASRASQDKRRETCRSMTIEDMSLLLEFISKNLLRGGVALLVLPNDNIYWEEALSKCKLRKKIIQKKDSVYIIELLQGNTN